MDCRFFNPAPEPGLVPHLTEVCEIDSAQISLSLAPLPQHMAEPPAQNNTKNKGESVIPKQTQTQWSKTFTHSDTHNEHMEQSNIQEDISLWINMESVTGRCWSEFPVLARL